MATQSDSMQLKELVIFLRSRYPTWTDAFVALDKLNQRQLTPGTFASGLQAMGFSTSGMEGLYRAIDTENAGAISLPVFLTALEGVEASCAPTPGRTSPSRGVQLSGGCHACLAAPQPFARVASASRAFSADAVRGIPGSLSVPTSSNVIAYAPLQHGVSRGSFGERIVASAQEQGRDVPLWQNRPTSPGPAPHDNLSRSDAVVGGATEPGERLPAGAGLTSMNLPSKVRVFRREVMPAAAGGRLQPASASVPVPMAAEVDEKETPRPQEGLDRLGPMMERTPRGLVSTPNGKPSPTNDLPTSLQGQLTTLRSQLDIERLERQVDIRALRAELNEKVSTFKHEALERAQDELFASTSAIKCEWMRELEEYMTKTMTLLDVKLDGLNASVRSSAADSASSQKLLEAQVAERCDLMNDLIVASTARADAAQQQLEQNIADLKLELAEAMHKSGQPCEALPSESTVDTTSETSMLSAFEALSKETRKRLTAMEEELQRTLVCNMSVEGQAAHRQVPILNGFADSSSGATLEMPEGGSLDSTWHHLLERMQNLEKKVDIGQSEQQSSDGSECHHQAREGPGEEKHKRMEDMLVAIAAQLPVLVKGDLCTLADVQSLLQGELMNLRTEFGALRHGA
mmetsp:Transcript_66123/g.123367  ORF Transcript_66123/g.123367 Transcript_66123/m.123367 type:complete len:631 (+) Transcript_66123:103-1995(+)